MDRGKRGVGQWMWISFQFYNNTIKSANVDMGGGKMVIHKMWIKINVFLTPPLCSKANEIGLFYSIPF